MNTALKVVEEANDLDTLKRIERYISNPPENSRVFTITPDVAVAILDGKNNNNRPKSAAEVKKLADHMSARKWNLTGDTIKFSESGILLDGQHRLSACAQSGVEFKTHIVFGIADGAFDFLDVGKKRTPAHVLSIAGYVNAGRLAGAIRWAYLLDENRVKLRDTLEPTQVLQLARGRYADLGAFLPMGQAINKVSPLITDTIASAIIYYLHKKNPQKAIAFYEGWAVGAWGGKFKVIDKLNAEIRVLNEASNGRINDVVRAALIVRAWNAFVEGRRGTSRDFTWSLKNDEFPEIKG